MVRRWHVFFGKANFQVRAVSFRQGRYLGGLGLRVEEKTFFVEELLIFSSTETNMMISESALEHVLYCLDRIKKGQIDKLDDGGFTEFLALVLPPIQQQFGSSHSPGWPLTGLSKLCSNRLVRLPWPWLLNLPYVHLFSKSTPNIYEFPD